MLDIASIVNGLVTDVIGGAIVTLAGPLLTRLREKLFWGQIFTSFVSNFCKDYRAFEHSEGDPVFALDERFFRDPAVREEFTERIVTGHVNESRLRARFIELYGEGQIEIFDRNLHDALVAFRHTLETTLEPGERAAFADLQNRLTSLDGKLKESTDAILQSDAQTRSVLTAVPERVRAEVSELLGPMLIQHALRAEYSAELDLARKQLHTFQPNQALNYLTELKSRAWSNLNSHDRARLLIYTGFAYLQLNQIENAAQKLTEALGLDPDNSDVLCDVALGALIQGDSQRCEKLAREAIKLDPTNMQAYARLVQSSMPDETFESILSKVPKIYRSSTVIAMALAQMAGLRGLESDAEQWFRVAIKADDRDDPDLLAALADLLLDRLLQSRVMRMQGIASEGSHLADEVLVLYNHAWGRVAQTEIRQRRLHWLVNRATAKEWLGDISGAASDLDEALSTDQHNAKLLWRRALLAQRTKDLAKATELLRRALDIEQTREIKVLLSATLFEADNRERAERLAEEVLQEANLPADARCDVTYIATLAKLKRGAISEASMLADSLQQSLPDDPRSSLLQAMIARYAGRSDECLRLLTKTRLLLPENADWITRYGLAEELAESGQFQTAAEILEPIVDTSEEAEPVRRLLYWHYRAGNLGRALAICEGIRKKHGPRKLITEIESAIYEEMGDLETAKKTCQQYLAAFPGSKIITLRLAAVNYRLRAFEELDEFLDSTIELNELTLHSHIVLAQLHLLRARQRRALEIAYETRRRFFNDPEAHLAYVRIFFNSGNDKQSWLDAKEADIDTAVCIADQTGGNTWWIIIENRADPNSDRGEISTQHFMARQVLHKKLGDTIVIDNPVRKQILSIKDIKHKFVRALNEVLEGYEIKFPETPGIWRIPVEIATTPGAEIKGFQAVLAMVDQRSKFMNEAERTYSEGHLLIGQLAIILGMNPIEVHARLTDNPEIGLRCFSGNPLEIQRATGLLHSNPKFIADITSLFTIHQLNIADALVKRHGKIGIVRSTVEVIQSLLIKQLGNKEGYWAIGKEGNQYTKLYMTKDVIERNRQVLESLLRWTENNCDIHICQAVLKINREMMNQLEELIGTSFIETLLVANDENALLYSEDATLRALANTHYGISSVWTQPMLIDLRDTDSISKNDYEKRVIQLTCLHYYHTSIDASILMEAARTSNWRLTYPLNETLRMIGGKHSDVESATKVATHFLRQLWNQKILPDQYERLVIAVLDALATNRRNRQEVLNIFGRCIRAEFMLAPTELMRLQGIMKAWAHIHPM